jgi:hypothetical protein
MTLAKRSREDPKATILGSDSQTANRTNPSRENLADTRVSVSFQLAVLVLGRFRFLALRDWRNRY